MRKQLALALAIAVLIAPIFPPVEKVVAQSETEPPSIQLSLDSVLPGQVDGGFKLTEIQVGISRYEIEQEAAREVARVQAEQAAEAKRKAAVASKQVSTTPITELQVYAREQVIEKWGASAWDAFHFIISKESGWNPNAQNPHSTAYGLGQFLDGTWRGVGCVKTSDPYVQIRCTIKYIENRYKTPENALAYWLSNRSY